MSDERKPIGYDPMTGQPIYAQNDEKPDMFDPYTGKPLSQTGANNNTNSDSSFSGEMIGGNTFYRSAENSTSNNTGAFRQNGMPNIPNIPKVNVSVTKAGSSNKLVFVLAGAVVVVLLAVVLLIGALYLNRKPVKIYRAAIKTANDAGYLADDIKKGAIKGKAFTVSVEGDVSVDGMKVGENISIAVNGKEKQLYGNIDMPYIGDYEVIAELNAKDLRMMVPTVDDTVFVYNYTEEKDGILNDMLSDDEIDSIDECLMQAYQLEADNSSDAKEISKITKDFYMGLEFQKIDSQLIEVDGKDRKCAGYEITVTEEDILEFYKELFAYYEKEYNEEFQALMELSGEDMDLDDVLDELEYELDDMDDVQIDVYLYKGMFAAICVPTSYGDVWMEFNGGDYRLQNACLYYEDDGDKYEYFEVKGERNKSEDELNIYVEEEKVLSYSYDTKSGNFDIDYDDGYDSFSLSGNLKTSRKGYVVSVDLSGLGMDDSYFTISALKGADMKKISGEEFDIGNADYSDFMSLDDWIDLIETIDRLM